MNPKPKIIELWFIIEQWLVWLNKILVKTINNLEMVQTQFLLHLNDASNTNFVLKTLRLGCYNTM